MDQTMSPSFVNPASLLCGLMLLAVPAVAVTGNATFYGGNLSGGNCLFTGYALPTGLDGTAYSGASWNLGAACGACLDVTGPRGSVKVMVCCSKDLRRYLGREASSHFMKVVDKCPECATTNLDLFESAFTKIGDRNAGIIPITWNQVPCGITTPLTVRNKSGTSQWW